MKPTILGKIKRDDNWGTGVKSADDKLTLLKLALLDDELKVDPEHPEYTRVVQQELYKIAAAGYDGGHGSRRVHEEDVVERQESDRERRSGTLP